MRDSKLPSPLSRGIVHSRNQRVGGQATSAIDEIELLRDAVRLLEHGARTKLVCEMTGVAKATVRRFSRERAGRVPMRGPTPFTDNWYVAHDRRMLHAALIWRLHQRLFDQRSPARSLINVYEVYRAIVHKPLLDVTRVAFVLRLVSTRLWEGRNCNTCHTDYIAPVDVLEQFCPGCRLYYRHHCWECGERLEAPRRNDRLCGSCGQARKSCGTKGR